MPNYRRYRARGATYFFTVNLATRGEATLVKHVDLLRNAYSLVRKELPFRTDAVVVLPDHLHAVWTLPNGDADFSTRWKRIKREFTVSLQASRPRSHSKWKKGEAGLWQRRFWEHMIRDEEDLSRHLIYTWCNPVKHGLVERSIDWPYSSLHREIKKGLLPKGGM